MREPLARCLAVLMLLTGTACGRDEDPAAGGERPAADTTYLFDRPDARFELPERLSEISGLSVLDERRLVAVEDERGTLYLLDAETGEVVEERAFGGEGDYEGVEVAGARIFVLRSDGDLYELAGWEQEGGAVKRETRLDGACDAEGLAHDPANGRLLIACKEDGGLGAGRKAVFAYDLESGSVAEAPAYVLDVEGLSRRVADGSVDEAVRRIVEPVMDLGGFKPSALTVDPLSGRLYVLSSTRPALAVLEGDGRVAHVWMLPDTLFAQPEALAFLPGGDLFVASEAGGDRPALLLRFDRRGPAP